MERAQFLVKLRSNIALEGDLLLARLEAQTLLGTVPEPVERLRDLGAFAGGPDSLCRGPVTPPSALVRPAGVQGYAAVAPLDRLAALVRRGAFAQQMYCTVADSDAARSLLEGMRRSLGNVLCWRAAGSHLAVYAVAHNALLELSAPATRDLHDPDRVAARLDLLLDGMMGSGSGATAAVAMRALAAPSTTSQLSHDMHYYKAKFFPRMARALINCTTASSAAQHHIFDPFAGSGTTLLEASLLTTPSTGIDVDPLSVLIASGKLDLLGADSGRLMAEHNRIAALLALAKPEFPGTTFDFPDWLRRNRRADAATLERLGAEIAAASLAVSGSEPSVSAISRVLLSDAVTRRLRMRFLGTGVGRFSLTLSAGRTVQQTLVTSMRHAAVAAAVSQWLLERLRIEPAPAVVLRGDARRLPAELESCGFDGAVTSPPYLPASSGRESYAQARALPLIALGLHSATGVAELAEGSVASMQAGERDLAALTAEERSLVRWLAGDPLRAIKAQPTARYFLDMGAAFDQMLRALRPGSLAAVVSGKQSTYYRYADRVPLRVVPAAELLAERARLAGFRVEALHDIQLQKSNRNARPRSLDDYYETLILLRVP